MGVWGSLPSSEGAGPSRLMVRVCAPGVCNSIFSGLGHLDRCSGFGFGSGSALAFTITRSRLRRLPKRSRAGGRRCFPFGRSIFTQLASVSRDKFRCNELVDVGRLSLPVKGKNLDLRSLVAGAMGSRIGCPGQPALKTGSWLMEGRGATACLEGDEDGKKTWSLRSTLSGNMASTGFGGRVSRWRVRESLVGLRALSRKGLDKGGLPTTIAVADGEGNLALHGISWGGVGLSLFVTPFVIVSGVCLVGPALLGLEHAKVKTVGAGASVGCCIVRGAGIGCAVSGDAANSGLELASIGRGVEEEDSGICRSIKDAKRLTRDTFSLRLA